ncbi:MAG: TIGR00282 family metallophosphoesterase [Dehalococcoidia bacterium]|jgi:metallophosphoesterase (TIGR00282 family)
MKVLMVGDAVGRTGREALATLLPALRRELAADVVIANGENAAAGRGITPNVAEEMFRAGVDVITTGNHVWDQKEIIPYLDSGAPILRPLNYPSGVAGRGILQDDAITVINLQGRVFMVDIDDPFRIVDQALADLPDGAIVIVDMHAEATSEKMAMGWYLDGRVSAVLGTHTHVPTADARVLPRGTAFVCDVGMTGARDSVIGDSVEGVLQRFLTAMPVRLQPAGGPAVLNAVLVDVDEQTGRARSIVRVDRETGNDQQG